MNSCEVVRRAIEFDDPDRLPLRFESLGFSDVAEIPVNQVKHGDLNRLEAVDEWGCTWKRTSMKNMGQVKIHPLLDLTGLKSYSFPNPDDPALYARMEAGFEGKQGKYILTSIFMLLFERMHALEDSANPVSAQPPIYIKH